MPVDAENIPSNKYFETAITQINSAKTSIQVVMYLVSIAPEQPNSEPYRLLQALIEAKARGVEVKVILDQNIDFESESSEEALYRNKNQKAYELLIKNKVPVYFDTSSVYTHSKVIIFDHETILLGSTNWSRAALTRNNEANLLVRSKDLAHEIESDLNKIPLQENIPAFLTPSVPIPADFVTNKKLLGEMASQSDERALDIYLYLQKEYDGNKLEKITLDYDNLAKYLNINHMSIEAYRRQINKTLSKLDEKYNLIKFESPRRNQDATILLKSHATLDSTEPQDNAFINLPTSFFRYEWNKSLPLSAKTMYLIYCFYSQASHQGSFSISRETLSKNHHISESFISEANSLLREQNLLDIQYSSLEDISYHQRKPNIYLLNNLYDPKDLQKELKSLEVKVGKDKLQRAIHTSSIVFEQNNLKTIQTLLDLENQYGPQVIQEASMKLKEKNKDNPKRSAGYLINTIKSMALQKQSNQ